MVDAINLNIREKDAVAYIKPLDKQFIVKQYNIEDVVFNVVIDFLGGFVHVLLLASGALFLSLFIYNKNTIARKTKNGSTK